MKSRRWRNGSRRGELIGKQRDADPFNCKGLGLPDLAVGASDCGQYLILTCGGELVALIGAMGSDVETVEFADGSRYRVEELMDRVAG